MNERHQDYMLSLTLPAGGLTGVELKLDWDAPFALRWVKQRWTPTATPSSWAYRFRLPNGRYFTEGTLIEDTFGNGTLNLGRPIYPQCLYPAGSSILIDLVNNALIPLVGVNLLFRGSKVFAHDIPGSQTYPHRCSLEPFSYRVAVPGIVQSNGNANLNNALTIQDDADFVLRYGFADAFSLTAGNGTYNQMYVQIKDKWLKPYSNIPIHVDDVFGSSNSVAAGSNANCYYRPGLFTPEIYLPRNWQLYFDIFRNDSSGGTVAMQFNFGGVKVFRR
jgi:hypothetical protein